MAIDPLLKERTIWCTLLKARLRGWIGTLKAKFGLFIHWGAYSLAGVEASWPIMTPEMAVNSLSQPHHLRSGVYGAAQRFNPHKFDARAWVRLAQESGMQYIVLTAKHHDGFCMFDAPRHRI